MNSMRSSGKCRYVPRTVPGIQGKPPVQEPRDKTDKASQAGLCGHDYHQRDSDALSLSLGSPGGHNTPNEPSDLAPSAFLGVGLLLHPSCLQPIGKS